MLMFYRLRRTTNKRFIPSALRLIKISFRKLLTTHHCVPFTIIEYYTPENNQVPEWKRERSKYLPYIYLLFDITIFMIRISSKDGVSVFSTFESRNSCINENIYIYKNKTSLKAKTKQNSIFVINFKFKILIGAKKLLLAEF